MIRSGDPTSLVDSILDPLVLDGREIPGYISSRLMAAYDLGDGRSIHVALSQVANGRLFWHYVLDRAGEVITQGYDLDTAISATYGEVALAAVEFLNVTGGT